jgi:hypothetical protein
MVLRSIFRRGFAADASKADNETDCMVMTFSFGDERRPRHRGFSPFLP